MSQSLLYMTLGQLILERPERFEVLDRHGLDYCCGGRKVLSVECAVAGLDAAAVCADLAAAEPDARALPAALARIAGHIDQVHHAGTRQAMPTLMLAAKGLVQSRPADTTAAKLSAEIGALCDDLEQHMLAEEKDIFPYAMGRSRRMLHVLSRHINAMIIEHDQSAHAMERIRSLTDDYAEPADDAYCAVVDLLRALDADLHRHMFEENNLLFPLALMAATRGSTR